MNQLKRLKGSDASNVHDEEPGEDEIEFSDDEAEAVHRSRLKQKYVNISFSRSIILMKAGEEGIGQVQCLLQDTQRLHPRRCVTKT